MKRKRLYSLALLIIVFLGFIIYSYNAEDTFVNTPDEIVQKFFGENYIKEGRMYLEFNDEPVSYIRPRGTEVINNKIVSMKFIGFPTFFGVYSLFYLGIFNMITALLATLTILFVFLISMNIYKDRKKALCSGILLLFLPFFWYWANHPFMENISSIFFFTAGYYFFLRVFENKSLLLNYILAAAFFSVSLAFRYDTGILLFAMLIPYIKEIKNIKLSYIFVGILVFSIFLLPILLLSNQIYGGYFEYGQKILNTRYEAKYEAESSFSINNIYSYFKEAFNFLPIYFICIIILLFKTDMYKEGKSRRFLFGLLLYLFLFSIIIIAFNPLKHPNILHESYTRYFLGFFVFSAILLPNLLDLKLNKKLKTAILSILIISMILSSTPIFIYKTNLIKSHKEKFNFLISETTEDSIIVLGKEDKFIYPQRKTISVELFWDSKKIIDYKKLGLVISSLATDNEIYIYAKDIEKEKVLKAISYNDKTTILINKENELYKIIPKNETK